MIGVRRLTSDHDLVALVEGRLSTDVVDGLRGYGLTHEEIYSLVIPRRTLAHRRARREALSRDESDRVIRVARIAALAEEVFGDPQRSLRWMRAAKRQFQGRTPLQLVTKRAHLGKKLGSTYSWVCHTFLSFNNVSLLFLPSGADILERFRTPNVA
jgi:putative toxin-antitoxin system antitoxin component (TIGR02293 family)